MQFIIITITITTPVCYTNYSFLPKCSHLPTQTDRQTLIMMTEKK